MLVKITALYSALCALLVLALAYLVTRQRHLVKVNLGDGGQEPLQLAIAVHRNAVEYIPIALLLMLIAELDHAPGWLLHGFGVALLVGRLLHAEGLSRSSGESFGRFSGTLLTWVVIAGLAIVNLIRLT